MYLNLKKRYKNKFHADINECLSNPCSVNAECQNTDGNFTCTCKDGFNGTGFICNGNFSQITD